MASVQKKIGRDGKTATWYVVFINELGKQKWERINGGKKDADTRRNERAVEEDARKAGTYTPPPEPKALPTLEEYATSWLSSYAATAVSARVLDNYKRSLRLHVCPTLGTLRLDEITRSRVRALIQAKLAEGKASSTVRNAIVPLREMLGHAADDDLIVKNPIAGLSVSQGKKKKIQPPTRAQVQAIIAKANPDAREAIIVATVTGLRRGELFGLRWADIDDKRRTIRVHASNYGANVAEKVKTEAGERLVPLFESARKVLLARRMRTRFKRPDDLVFGSVVGTAIDPGNFVKREFKTALKAAGLAGIRWHDLRHYAVSALIAQRADIKLLQAIAGHASATMTLDVYGHLMSERVTEAATLYDPLRPAASKAS